jgi:hypothetical protein
MCFHHVTCQRAPVSARPRHSYQLFRQRHRRGCIRLASRQPATDTSSHPARAQQPRHPQQIGGTHHKAAPTPASVRIPYRLRRKPHRLHPAHDLLHPLTDPLSEPVTGSTGAPDNRTSTP